MDEPGSRAFACIAQPGELTNLKMLMPGGWPVGGRGMGIPGIDWCIMLVQLFLNLYYIYIFFFFFFFLTER